MSTGLNQPILNALLASFACRTGEGRKRHIVSSLDNANRHAFNAP